MPFGVAWPPCLYAVLLLVPINLETNNILLHCRQGVRSEGGVPDLAGVRSSDEQPADVGHLLDDTGLGLTRPELEELFDFVDEGDGCGLSKSAESGDGGSGAVDEPLRRKRRLDARLADRGLLLFLKRRGQRRSEYHFLRSLALLLPVKPLSKGSRVLATADSVGF